MSKLSKFLKIGSGVAKPFLPGGVGTILDVVSEGLADKDDPANEAAILALASAVAELEERLQKLEAK